jgi:hypothetical protein
LSPAPDEVLLWTLLRRFESDTLERYRKHVPELATPEKRSLISQLEAEADDAALDASELAAPLSRVLDSAATHDAGATLWVQGLVLELLGRNIYAAAERARDLSDPGRVLAARGREACSGVVTDAVRLADQQIGRGQGALDSFTASSHDVLSTLDELSDPVDRIFGARIEASFAELMGEFTADLLEACVGLGMERRRVIGHLASASMGF